MRKNFFYTNFFLMLEIAWNAKYTTGEILKKNKLKYLKNSIRYSNDRCPSIVTGLYCIPPWLGACTFNVSRKYIGTFLSYSANIQTLRTVRQTDRRTDNIYCPGPSEPREIIQPEINEHMCPYMTGLSLQCWLIVNMQFMTSVDRCTSRKMVCRGNAIAMHRNIWFIENSKNLVYISSQALTCTVRGIQNNVINRCILSGPYITERLAGDDVIRGGVTLD